MAHRHRSHSPRTSRHRCPQLLFHLLEDSTVIPTQWRFPTGSLVIFLENEQTKHLHFLPKKRKPHCDKCIQNSAIGKSRNYFKFNRNPRLYLCSWLIFLFSITYRGHHTFLNLDKIKFYSIFGVLSHISYFPFSLPMSGLGTLLNCPEYLINHIETLFCLEKFIYCNWAICFLFLLESHSVFIAWWAILLITVINFFECLLSAGQYVSVLCSFIENLSNSS